MLQLIIKFLSFGKKIENGCLIWLKLGWKVSFLILYWMQFEKWSTSLCKSTPELSVTIQDKRVSGDFIVHTEEHTWISKIHLNWKKKTAKKFMQPPRRLQICYTVGPDQTCDCNWDDVTFLFWEKMVFTFLNLLRNIYDLDTSINILT